MGRWETLKTDAVGFLERWGAQAARLGWATLDVFGVNAVRPFERLDAAGLIRLLDGRSILALTASEAVIEAPPYARQAYRRKSASQVTARRCALWEIGR